MLMERKMMMKDIVPFVPWTNRSSRREPPIYLVDGREDDDEGHRAVRATRPSARWEGDIGVDAVGRRNPVLVEVGSRINNAKLEGTKVINARHGRSGRSERSTVETTGRRIALEVGFHLMRP